MEKTVRALNKDSSVTAVIIQQPLPEHLNSRKIVDLIDPFKDAEGVNPCNLGTLFYGDNVISPCTAAAVMELVLSTGVDLYGKEAVVVGHSRIVGKPLSLMLLNKMATVTVCHVATSDKGVLKDHIGRAEVLIVAVGKPHVIKGDWVREGAVVIDVGINKLGNDIVGDVEFDIASKRASFITPVPGGVGPLTTAMLMRNVIELHKIKLGKR
jgi:methylenetetrahydrofolate dehydrogenase (NADP+)/methenyltetrahydrofolate cyclohydrolase